MNDPLKPYTVTIKSLGGPLVHVVNYNAQMVASLERTAEDCIEMNESTLATLLNDAFLKGVETERLRWLVPPPVAATNHRVDIVVPEGRVIIADGEGAEWKVPNLAELLGDKAPITLPWSDLTDSAKDSVRASYPWSRWTEAQLAACRWTKSPSLLSQGDMCIWRPAAQVEEPPFRPIFLIAELEPQFPCWLWNTRVDRWYWNAVPRPLTDYDSHWSSAPSDVMPANLTRKPRCTCFKSGYESHQCPVCSIPPSVKPTI